MSLELERRSRSVIIAAPFSFSTAALEHNQFCFVSQQATELY